MNALQGTDKGALELLTLSDIRRIFGCSRSHLYKLRSGKFPGMPPLPVVPFGRSVRIRREALVAWLLLLERREREAQYASGLFTRLLVEDDDPELMAGA